MSNKTVTGPDSYSIGDTVFTKVANTAQNVAYGQRGEVIHVANGKLVIRLEGRAEGRAGLLNFEPSQLSRTEPQIGFYYMSNYDFLKSLLLLAQEYCALFLVDGDSHSVAWLMFWFATFPLVASILNAVAKCTPCACDDLLVTISLEALQGLLWIYFSSPSSSPSFTSILDAPVSTILTFLALGCLQLLISLVDFWNAEKASLSARVKASTGEISAALSIALQNNLFNLQFGCMQPYAPYRHPVNYYFGLFSSWFAGVSAKDLGARPPLPVEDSDVPAILKRFFKKSAFAQWFTILTVIWMATAGAILQPWTMAYASHSLVQVLPPCCFPASYWLDGHGFLVGASDESASASLNYANCSSNDDGWSTWMQWANRSTFLIAPAPQPFQSTFKVGPLDVAANSYNFVDRDLFNASQDDWLSAGYAFDVSTNVGFVSWDFMVPLIQIAIGCVLECLLVCYVDNCTE